ncbi:MAG: M20/M25/M40 family metallo-hydrolase [bacterium]|nr:M20/M25/M40 family metallo-hydrolase [bacterium]
MTPEAVAESVDADVLVERLQQAIAIPSVTLHEGEFARWVHDQLDDNAWDHKALAPFDASRANVYASVGHGAPSLVLAGHLDTVHADDWKSHWAGTERADPFAASIIDREIWGRGSADQKAGICAILEALRAIRRSGCRPKGSVTALFVSDEESGQPGSGVSAGMKAAIADGEFQQDQPPDLLVYTEPTTSAIYTAQMGFLIADIELTGQSAYFGRPELGVDALKAGHRLLTALWEHSESLRTQPAHPLIGEAFLLVTEVRSGESIAVPGRFDLSLIRKVLPHESLDNAAQSIRDITARVAADHGIEATVEFTAPRDHPVGGTPDETSADHPAVQALGASITAITGDAPRIEAAPYWSEKSFLSAMGVPGVYFAPGDISHAHTPFERVEIDELVAATRTLAHFVASWCGLEPAPTTN